MKEKIGGTYGTYGEKRSVCRYWWGNLKKPTGKA